VLPSYPTRTRCDRGLADAAEHKGAPNHAVTVAYSPRIPGRWARATIMPLRPTAAVEDHSSLRAVSCAQLFSWSNACRVHWAACLPIHASRAGSSIRLQLGRRVPAAADGEADIRRPSRLRLHQLRSPLGFHRDTRKAVACRIPVPRLAYASYGLLRRSAGLAIVTFRYYWRT
jgi:hypothetical protein